MPVVRVCLFSDGVRLLIEVWDQATGFPGLRRTGAELTSELADPEHDKALMGLGNRPAGDAERPAGDDGAQRGSRNLQLHVRWGRAGEAPGQLRLVARVEDLRLA